MVTPLVRLKNLLFAVLGLLAMAHLATGYADLGRLAGVDGDYTVTVELAETGGLYQHANVTYRGVTVGRVGAVELTSRGVRAKLRIRDSAPRIPADLQAVVANYSAIGEQYIDLRPLDGHPPYLEDGSVIPRERTRLPAPVTRMLTSLDRMAGALPLESLETVVDELGTAFDGQAGNLEALLESGTEFIEAADEALPATTALITDAEAVLRTQREEADALRAFATGAAELAGRLADSDADLRRLIGAGPQAAAQVGALLRETGPDLSVVLANLLTTAEIAVTRQDGIEELMVRVPQAVAAGSAAVGEDGLHAGLVLTFFDPLPCTSGYEGTVYRNGLDTGPAPGVNTEARCTADPGSGVHVRGSQNSPGPGTVPDPARPGGMGAPR
ncbi:MCE family protein [Streptomyces sp. YIM 98790]|uniref:MCE family protein n=1 Tax=Streptomyces sp. YIM 98790 TaxID=2689077 RepID=UPI00140E3FFE|nr:MlaD family protein [Streptomyces sp. YIM 98790]